MISKPVFPWSPGKPDPRTVGPEQPFSQRDKFQERIMSPPPGGGGIEFPFQLQDASTGGGSPVAKINVRYGTLQDVVPTNVATDISLSNSSTYYFYIDLQIDIDGVFVAATLVASTSAQPADADYHGYITLGEADTGTGVVSAIRQAATHSLRFSMCNRVVVEGVLEAAGTYEFWGF